MELRQRKRINNSLPRFNNGNDYSWMDQKGIVNYQGKTANDLTTMIGSNAPVGSSIAGSGSASPSFNIGQKPASQWTNQQQPVDWKSTAYNNAYAMGELFSQNSKFNDSTSNNIRNYGGAIAKMIPGKYGKAAQGVVDLAGNTIGMYNYHHSGDQMMNDSGTEENTVNGVGYTTQNVLDTGSAYRDVKSTGAKNAISTSFKTSAAGFALTGGNPLGAIAGGLIGLGAGIFGGRHAAIRQGRINRNAIAQTAQINQLQQSYADTQNFNNLYYQRHGDTTGSILYANRGKDLISRKRLVNTTKV